MTLYLVLNFTHTINRTIKDSLLISKKDEGHQLSNSLKTRKQINTKAGTDRFRAVRDCPVKRCAKEPSKICSSTQAQ